MYLSHMDFIAGRGQELQASPDAARAAEALRAALERDPPYRAQVRFESDPATGGWNAPTFAPWLEESIARASHAIYGREAMHAGCGGTPCVA